MTYMNPQDFRSTGFAIRWITNTSAWLASVAEKMQRKQVERITRQELQNMSTRELADLGIARSDINRIAREAAGTV